jgi:hypothetical protein
MIKDDQVNAIRLAGLLNLLSLARAHKQGRIWSVATTGDHGLNTGASGGRQGGDFLEISPLSANLQRNDEGSGVSSGRGLRGDRTTKTAEVAQKNSELARVFFEREIHGPGGHDGGYGVLINHLSHGVFKQHHVLVKGLDVALKLNAVDQINRDRDVLATQNI